MYPNPKFIVLSEKRLSRNLPVVKLWKFHAHTGFYRAVRNAGWQCSMDMISCPGAEPWGGSRVSWEMSPKDEKDYEQPGRTDLKTSTAGVADLNQSAMADLSQRWADISGMGEPQFGSQHTAAIRWMTVLLCREAYLHRQAQRASTSLWCIVQHGKERAMQVQMYIFSLFRACLLQTVAPLQKWVDTGFFHFVKYSELA